MSDHFEPSQAALPTEAVNVPSMIPQLLKQPLLVKDEEYHLVLRARNGDEAARRKIIEANMRLVCSIAKRYPSAQVPYEDLVQEGAIGLVKAVDKFDTSKGCRFSTYAIYWIRQAVRKAVTYRSRVIRLPAHAYEDSRRLIREREQFEATHGRPPTCEELALAIGQTVEKVHALSDAELDCLSLDSQPGTADYASLMPDSSAKNPEEAALDKLGGESARKLLAHLSPREREILVRRFGLNHEAPEPASHIARDLGISRSAVTQVEHNALRTLRRLAGESDAAAPAASMKPSCGYGR